MGNTKSCGNIRSDIAKGWKPNAYLTDMSMAYFQDNADFIAPAIFPICPVKLSTSSYYTFSKADLARDNVSRKPTYGKVNPAIMGQSDDTYACKVDQIILGIDQIGEQDYQRANTPGASDPRKSKVRFATEQMKLHLDRQFANGFFKPGIWANEWSGIAANPTGKQFLKFSDSNFDPVHFFNARMNEIKQQGRRKPNKLALGINSFTALCEHPDILERVKYTGSTANPAIVTEQVLAQLLSVKEVKVLESTYNAGDIGTEDMEFVCDPNSALFCYASDSPAIDEPSAGYIFTWDMLGNGNYMSIDQFEGEKGTHSEYIEGLMATAMKKTADDLAIFLKDCV